PTDNGGIFYLNLPALRDVPALDIDALAPFGAVAGAGEPGVDLSGFAQSRLFLYLDR
ncbi:hypothetical protein HC891_06810, partial [Candidatus Gracilibacteria bacterium]|nr:hypothetical protein [Candidatus Gracilibacteria bacterium]